MIDKSRQDPTLVDGLQRCESSFSLVVSFALPGSSHLKALVCNRETIVFLSVGEELGGIYTYI